MNTKSNVVRIEKQNPLLEYRGISDMIKELEKEKEKLRGEIYAIMDQLQTDVLPWGDCKAERKMIVQSRIDSKKVEEILGDRLNEVKVESSQIRLTVI